MFFSWGQGVSGGFYYNATASATAWAPAWTQRAWSNASTGYVHMYHAARWGGWQFKLHSRNDSDHSLQFACNLINTSDYSISHYNVECPKSGDAAVVIGGWQEARGDSISNQYTLPSLNDSYFVENIKVRSLFSLAGLCPPPVTSPCVCCVIGGDRRAK